MALSELTAAKIDHGLAALALDQLHGIAPPDGQVTTADIATRAGVSESTIRNIERMALARLASELLKQDLPAYLTRKLLQSLSPKN
jgi:transcriptional regulator with XRE-family HTH domain